MANSLYEIPVRRINGTETKLGEFSGKVLLVVNVASKCGLTPQYEGLEKLYEQYRAQGLEVLGFPANEFMGQEPGTNTEIAEFCQMKFGVKFPMFEKIVVKGEGQHPLYRYLTRTRPRAKKAEKTPLSTKAISLLSMFRKEGEIQWNFEKFLVDRKGRVIDRFAPTVTPDNPILVDAIKKALAEGGAA